MAADCPERHGPLPRPVLHIEPAAPCEAVSSANCDTLQSLLQGRRRCDEAARVALTMTFGALRRLTSACVRCARSAGTDRSLSAAHKRAELPTRQAEPSRAELPVMQDAEMHARHCFEHNEQTTGVQAKPHRAHAHAGSMGQDVDDAIDGPLHLTHILTEPDNLDLGLHPTADRARDTGASGVREGNRFGFRISRSEFGILGHRSWVMVPVTAHC